MEHATGNQKSSWIMVKADDTADICVFAYLLWLSCILCIRTYFTKLHLTEAIKRISLQKDHLTEERHVELDKV